jgi:hypothetical protein
MQGGVTIDLSDLKQITVHQKENVVSLGSGLRWQNVYDALAPYQLAVSGARWGHVGTGLLLGGTMSFLLVISNRFNLCFQVVSLSSRELIA